LPHDTPAPHSPLPVVGLVRSTDQ